MSASLCTLCMSCIDLLNFCPIQMWPIWFSVLWTGDIQVALCILLCGNTLPPIINLLNAQWSANVSPFSFIVPSLCLPMTSSYPVLFALIFALKSPMSRRSVPLGPTASQLMRALCATWSYYFPADEATLCHLVLLLPS